MPQHRQAAIEACRRVESGIEPLTPQLLYLAGYIYEDVGELHEAKRCFGEALDGIPLGESQLREAITTALGQVPPTEPTP